MNREEKLHIAKEAYRAIKAAIDDVESYKDAEIHCCWDECIWVDDEFFNYSDLKDKENG
jgi:hypothetical protein